MIEHILKRIVKILSPCPFIHGIVLGGSRATGMATEKSDIDIGIYYEPGQVDFNLLNKLASQLDDNHRQELICHEKGWGNWVNCGGWLTIDGCATDLILRDMNRVKDCIAQTNEGEISAHYQPGHPHAYLNVIYRGELASCQVLYARDAQFLEWKRQAEIYPDKLAEALKAFFLFEAKFSCALARKAETSKDNYYLSGHLFRSISALNQVLFALNRIYCLNEKKATWRIDQFPIAPANYRERVDKVFAWLGEDNSRSMNGLEQLLEDVEKCLSLQNVPT